MKNTKPKPQSLVAKRIIYRNHQRPHDWPLELTVDVPHGQEMDTDHAAAMVAARTTTPLTYIRIIEIVPIDPTGIDPPGIDTAGPDEGC